MASKGGKTVAGWSARLDPAPPTHCRQNRKQNHFHLFSKAKAFSKPTIYNFSMESLLSLSFDYLSSNDGIKIRKGLRQLEGLLAQICLSRSPSLASSSAAAIDRRGSMIGNLNGNGAPSKQSTKELSSLKDDPAFREFFKLQEGFEWNGITPPAVLPSYYRSRQ